MSSDLFLRSSLAANLSACSFFSVSSFSATCVPYDWLVSTDRGGKGEEGEGLRTPEPRYLSQFALGLGQRRLFLIELGLGGIQLHPLGLHHPVDPPINLDEGEEPSVRDACNAPMDAMVRCSAGCGTSMARTHMQSDLAASDTLPMMSGWKSDIRQYWPIFLSTRSEMLSLSKCTRVLMKLASPADGHIFVWFLFLFFYLSGDAEASLAGKAAVCMPGH